MSLLSEFTLFPLLPPELSILVWEMASQEPQGIPVHYISVQKQRLRPKIAVRELSDAGYTSSCLRNAALWTVSHQSRYVMQMRHRVPVWEEKAKIVSGNADRDNYLGGRGAVSTQETMFLPDGGYRQVSYNTETDLFFISPSDLETVVDWHQRPFSDPLCCVNGFRPIQNVAIEYDWDWMDDSLPLTWDKLIQEDTPRGKIASALVSALAGAMSLRIWLVDRHADPLLSYIQECPSALRIFRDGEEVTEFQAELVETPWESLLTEVDESDESDEPDDLDDLDDLDLDDIDGFDDLDDPDEPDELDADDKVPSAGDFLEYLIVLLSNWRHEQAGDNRVENWDAGNCIGFLTPR